jgi:hypothetical protein
MRAPDFDPSFQLIPEALRDLPQWIVWQYETRGEKATKVPVNPRTGNHASSTNPSTWTTFDEAVAACRASDRYAGVGFVFTADDPFAGVDLDDCLDEDGLMAPAAQAIVDEVDSYTEVSPSGRGVKIFLRGRKSTTRCRTKEVVGFGEIEVYDSGRFFCVTGLALPETPLEVNERQEALDALCERWLSDGEATPTLETLRPACDGDDDEVIERAMAAKNGAKFGRLWRGDTSDYGGDDSRADLALCTMIAYWVGADRARIDRIYRQSGLLREKWERQDYRDATIEKAIATAAKEPAHQVRRSLPHLQLDVDEHRVIDDAIAALAADEDLFSRGGALVRVTRVESLGARVDRPAGAPVITAVPAAHLRDRVTRWVTPHRFSSAQGIWVPAHPPTWLIAGIEARGDWPGIRELVGVAECPFLRPDGSVWQDPGYDEATGVLFAPTASFPSIPAQASLDDAREALREILEVVEDFRFETEAHRAAWVAALLTPLARHAYDGPTPLFLVDANIRGAGKTLLSHTIGAIALGRSLPVTTFTADAAELRKQVTSIVMAGDPIILLDNIEGRLGGGVLDGALTATRWRDRILGGNTVVDAPLRTVFLATGNNVVIGGDTARRTVHIRLDVLDERPEDRSGFQHPNLLAWVQCERPRLLAAALTILVAHSRAGRPSKDLRPMGSFEGWSGTVREAVVWAGMPDPCEGRDSMVALADSSADTAAIVIAAWQEIDPDDAGVLVAGLLSRLYPPDRTKTPQDGPSVRMRQALEQLVGGSGRQPTVRAVANRLKGLRRRVVNGAYLDIDASDCRRGGAVWRVRPVGEENRP